MAWTGGNHAQHDLGTCTASRRLRRGLPRAEARFVQEVTGDLLDHLFGKPISVLGTLRRNVRGQTAPTRFSSKNTGVCSEHYLNSLSNARPALVFSSFESSVPS